LKLLILGHTIPEPTTTAAGSRMTQLISLFQEEGYTIHFATSALTNPRSLDLKSVDVTLDAIKLNDPSFDQYISNLAPDVVIFDRFIIEEHYGWRVAQHCPDAIRILDTEDLHFLRKARHQSIKKFGDLSEVNLYSDEAKREIASILRCDLSLIISRFELKLLIDTFGLDQSILHYLPFMVEDVIKESDLLPFGARNDFMTIGNLFHAPNVDSVLFLKKNIWPKIRAELPAAKLLVYGNYAPQQINELHSEKEGFIIKGWAPSLKEAMTKAKICLAPLRFGAGLKGKLLDAMIFGTPSVTTPIGAEGMYGSYASNFLAEDVEDFVKLSLNLFTNENDWNQSQQIGLKVIESNFYRSIIAPQFSSRLIALRAELERHRKKNFVGQILQHHTMQATRYMSKWIEEKNR